MEKALKKKILRAAFIVTFLIPFITSHAYGQAIKGNVAEAVKDAQAAGIAPVLLTRLLTLGYENQVEPAAIVRFIQTLTEVRREEIPV